MNRRGKLRRELESATLTRMEATRTQLLAANVGLRIGDQASKRGDNALTLWNIARALSAAPTVTLLGSIVFGSLLVGPKRVVPVVLRKGLTGLIARNVKTFVAR
ncbi:MAG: hypothetical protein ACTHKH_05095 [Trinickia sp.]|jgi:hypothetical protein